MYSSKEQGINIRLMDMSTHQRDYKMLMTAFKVF